MRFSNTTGQKRIEPLKRVFIWQASLETEIAWLCYLFFYVERNVYSDFRLKRNKALSSAFSKVLMIQTFFIMLTERTNYVLQELLRKKIAFLTKWDFFRIFLLSNFLWHTQFRWSRKWQANMWRNNKGIQKVKIGIACLLIPFLGSPMVTVLLHIISTHLTGMLYLLNSCFRTPHLFTCIYVFLNFSSSIYVTVPLFLRGFREKAKTLDKWE